MISKSQKIRLGVFVTLGCIAFLAVVGVLVVPKLLEQRDIYFIGFRDASVTGLVEGGTVKYQGLTVGFVSNISIDPKDIRRVIVEISLDHGTPIKEDTQAEMALLGITGLKLIELRSGSNESKPLKPGAFIQAGASMTDRLTDSAEAIARKAQTVMDNLAEITDRENRAKLVQLMENSNQTLSELHSLLLRNRTVIDTTLSNTQALSTDARQIARLTRQTMTRVDQIVESDSLNMILHNLVEITESIKKADLVRLMQEMNTTLERSNRMIRDLETAFTKSRADILSTIESLKETSDNLNQFTRVLSEDPSVLVRGVKPKDPPDDKLGK
jgi:phospholipid/cholesterol/gamma-HCH transport system substrate-binding protein